MMIRNKFGQKNGQDFWSENNKIIIGALLVFLFILIVVGYVYRDKFSNIVFGQDHTKIKDLDVLFFMSPTCPWCQKMKDVLEKEGTLGDFTMIDVNNEEGAKMAKMYGATQGLPTFVSKTKKTGTIGFKESTNDIIKELDSVQVSPQVQNSDSEKSETPAELSNEISPELIKELDIIVFTSDGCGWCKKLKDDIRALNIEDQLTILDIQNPESAQILRDFSVENKGVPLMVSRVSGKTTVGYKPFAVIIKELNSV